MRRTAAFLLVICLFFSLSAAAWAGPRAIPRPQAAQAAITSPQPFEALRGQVAISGTALHPQFQRYELYFKVEPGEDWIFIGEAHYEQVSSGVLGYWDTTSLPDGTYSLRLRVVRLDGNYDEAFVRQVLVANTQPTPTPTSEITPTPTLTPTPLPPTPTVVIELPVIPTPTPRPSPTPTSAATGAPAEAVEGESGGLFGLNRLLGQINMGDMGNAFLLGVKYALAAFLALGVYFVLKRFLGWLWARIRG